MDLEALQGRAQAGEPMKYLFFWGAEPRVPGAVDASCLSQWYAAPFELEGARYPTAEHFMMAEKARLFGDLEIAERILASAHPGEAKKLGREVRGYDDARWSAERAGVVVRGNLGKFGQHAALKRFLLETGDEVLVEASPADAIWGIGLSREDARAADPRRWRGQNLLGFALMEVRSRLRAESAR
jgi:ribA/ribD-fused uncharacterized protein